MSIFKRGDRVKCVDPSDAVILGRLYLVERVYHLNWLSRFETGEVPQNPLRRVFCCAGFLRKMCFSRNAVMENTAFHRVPCNKIARIIKGAQCLTSQTVLPS